MLSKINYYMKLFWYKIDTTLIIVILCTFSMDFVLIPPKAFFQVFELITIRKCLKKRCQIFFSVTIFFFHNFLEVWFSLIQLRPISTIKMWIASGADIIDKKIIFVKTSLRNVETSNII